MVFAVIKKACSIRTGDDFFSDGKISGGVISGRCRGLFKIRDSK